MGQLSFVEIGTGSVNTSYPVYTVYNNGWYSAIYPQTALGAAKTIEKIALNLYSGPKTFNNQKIYMKMTTSEVFADASYENPTANGYVEVFSGNLTMQTGWNEISLSTNFEYNGTGNLILHWENRSGTSNYGNFVSTTSTTNNNKGAGNDVSFPTTPGYLNPYPSTLPNIKFFFDPGDAPATPTNELPANNSIRANVSGPITITLGANTTAYDMYLSTDQALVSAMDASVKVVSNAAVSVAGDYSYTPSQLLQSKTQYYWKVVAKNATSSTASVVYTFLTQQIITQFPYNQGFEGEDVFVPGWYGDLSKTDWTYASTPINWNRSPQFNGHNSDGSAYINMFYNVLGQWSLMTPRFQIASGAMLSFWWKNNNPITGDKVVGQDTTYVQITTDGGENWTNLGILSPAEPNNYTFEYYDLSSYTGNNVYFRWLYSKPGQDAKAFFLDDVYVGANNSAPEIQILPASIEFDPICLGGHQNKYVTITNIGTANLVISGTQATGPFSCNLSSLTLSPGQQSSPTAITFEPESAVYSTGSITFVTNNANGNATVTCSGTGVNPLGNFFQSFDAINQIPVGWTAINSPWDQYSGVSIVQGTYDVFSAPYAAKILILNDSISPLMLVSQGVTGFDDHQLTFYAKDGSDYYDSIPLVIGSLSNPNDAATFTPYDTILLGDDFIMYTVEMHGNTNPYIGFKHGGIEKFTSMRIDDIAWEVVSPNPPNAASIVKPLQGATMVDIMMPIKLDWASGGGSPTGYKVYFGTNNPPTNLLNGLVLDANTTEYLISQEMEFNTTYLWKIVPFNQYGDCPTTPTWSFTTMEDPTISVFPYSEQFSEINNYPFQFDHPLGWSMEDVAHDNMYWDALMHNPGFPGLTYSEPAAMHVPFHMINPKNDWLFTPPLQLEAGKTYEVGCYIHTIMDMVTGLVYTEKLEIKFGADHTAAAMTSAVVADAVVDQEEEWVYVHGTIVPETDGAYYVGFHAYSDPNQYLLILDDVSVTQISNAAPVFVSTPDTTALAGEIYTYNIETYDSNDDAMTITAPVIPSWLTFTDFGNGSARLTGTPPVAGTYGITLAVSDAQETTQQVFMIDVITGIENVNNFKVELYPNPCKNELNINTSGFAGSDFTAEICSLTGQSIEKVNLSGEKAVLATGHLAAGVYILKVYSQNYIVISKFSRE